MFILFLLGIVLLLSIFYIHVKRNKYPARLPPGIYGWPIIGSMPSFTKSLIEQIEEKRRRLGDIFIWKIGTREILFLCDPSIIKKAFNNSFLLDRPHKFFTFDSWSLNKKLGIINSNGDLWLTHRRFSLKHLRDSGYGKSRLEDIITMETDILIKDILCNYTNEPTIIPPSLNLTNMNVIWRLAADKRFDKGDPELMKFQESLLKINEQIQGLVTLLDIFPWLVPITPKFVLKLIGFGELKETWEIIKNYIKKVIAERKMLLNKENPNGLIDAYLLEMENSENKNTFNDEGLLISLGDMFIAGSETTSSTIRWALQYMAAYPEMQKRAHDEIDASIQVNTSPSLSDKQKLPFIDAFCHEILRITTIAPLGVFHEASADTELEGYFIPKGTLVSSFLYGCHMNAKYWENPEKFNPERFLDIDGKFNGKNEALIPFSTGRRKCLGETLAKHELFLIVASLLQKFSIELPENETVSFKIAQKPLIFSFPNKVKIIFRKRY